MTEDVATAEKAPTEALDLFTDTGFGRAALKKLGPVPSNFRLYRAEWLGKNLQEATEMRVTGREFRASRSGALNVPVPRTIRTVVVTREEIQVER
jgi:hypothetical protein